MGGSGSRFNKYQENAPQPIFIMALMQTAPNLSGSLENEINNDDLAVGGMIQDE
jgi:hypothetical protein